MRHTTLNMLKQKRVTAEERAQVAGHAPSREDNFETKHVYGDDYTVAYMTSVVEMLDFREEMNTVKPWNTGAFRVSVTRVRKKTV